MVDINRVLFGVITPEGKDTFTATLNGETPKAKRKVAFAEHQDDDDDQIEDSPIPANYSGPKTKKLHVGNAMQRLASCQRINEEELVNENIQPADILVILGRIPTVPSQCTNCCTEFPYFEVDGECLCPACMEEFSQ